MSEIRRRRTWARHRLARAGVVTLLYLAIAVGVTWPVARHPTVLVPAGATRLATVPLFNAWTIWWNAHSATRGFEGYWTGPVFWPHAGTFAFSEPQPATLAVAPVIWLTGSRILAYNVWLLGSLLLNGLFAVRLLRTCRVGWWYAVCGGAAVLLLPVLHEQLDVIQMVPLFPVLCALDALLRLSRRPTVLRGMAAGCAFGFTFWTSIHHALFVGVLAGATFPLWPVRWMRRETWWAFLAMGGSAMALSLPLMIPMRAIMAEYAFERSERLVDQLSTHPREFVTAPGPGFLPGGLVSEAGNRRRLPGWLISITAVLAVAMGIRTRRRRVLVFLVAVAIASVILSLGTNLRVGGWQPWWTLTTYVPGMALVRNVFRFVYFFQLMIVLLAFQGLWLLRLTCRRRCASRGAIRFVLPAFAMMMAAELVPRPGAVAGAPTFEHNQQWIEFIAGECAPGKGVVHLPYAAGGRVADFDETVRMMYLGTWHTRPLVNGYSGFFPKSHFQLQRLLSQGFPSDAALDELFLRNVDLIVVDSSLFPRGQMTQPGAGPCHLIPLLHDPCGRDVYRLTRKPVTRIDESAAIP